MVGSSENMMEVMLKIIDHSWEVNIAEYDPYNMNFEVGNSVILKHSGGYAESWKLILQENFVVRNSVILKHNGCYAKSGLMKRIN